MPSVKRLKSYFHKLSQAEILPHSTCFHKKTPWRSLQQSTTNGSSFKSQTKTDSLSKPRHKTQTQPSKQIPLSSFITIVTSKRSWLILFNLKLRKEFWLCSTTPSVRKWLTFLPMKFKRTKQWNKVKWRLYVWQTII